VIGKPGYGTFAEAACNGVPMLYVRRDDGWPEEPYLIDWFEQRARTIEMERAALARGALAAPLAALWQRPPRDPPRADGVAQATTHILSLLAPRVAHAR
jgi:UDP-N-acetylglucosamine:LPS N-acetylglucosamine transferase